MLVLVLRPMAVGGATSSTRDSRAARETSASAAVTSPGAMAPPTNSPRSSTQSKLVAVPKSTTMTGAPYSATAATALQTRSAPTSPGLSTLNASGTLTPGCTVNGRTPKYPSHIHSSVCCTGGATVGMATPGAPPG